MGPLLVRKAIPMLVGIASVLLFNVVDTIFVGQLGPVALAAMSFTFPVTFIVLSLTMGMGIGATAVIATAVGEGALGRVRRLTTDALALALAAVVVTAGVGLWVQEPLFRALGAGPEHLPLILDYMTLWWGVVGFLVIPMVGNAAIRATGDMTTPSMIMIASGLVNLALDPLLIFGIGPFPRLELVGAALATGIAWMVSLSLALWVLAGREKMIEPRLPPLPNLLASWYGILRVAVPAAAANVMTPVAGAALTRLAASHGTAAVAAWGVGTRVEGLATVGIMALSTALTPFTGQNLGAGRRDRVKAAFRFAVRAALAWGIGVSALLALVAPMLAAAFNADPEVRRWIVRYLWVVPLSFAPLGVVHAVSSLSNGAQRSSVGAGLSVVRLFVCSVPCALIGSAVNGMAGMLIGVAVGNALAGGAGLVVGRWLVRSVPCPVEEGVETLDANVRPSSMREAPGGIDVHRRRAGRSAGLEVEREVADHDRVARLGTPPSEVGEHSGR